MSSGRAMSRKDIAVLDDMDVAIVPQPRLSVIEPDSKAKRSEGTKRIYATVEMLKGGFLKGRVLSLHSKIESMCLRIR